MTRDSVFCYCAFWKNPRKIFRRKAIGLKNGVLALGLTLSLSYLFWKTVTDARGLIVFVTFFMALEIISILRARIELTCPHCGFDAALYHKNREAACNKVKTYLEKRQNDPAVWLAQKPPLRFSKRKSRKNSTREIVA